MSQIDVSKITGHYILGGVAGSIHVSKLVAHVLLLPGTEEDPGGATTQEAYAYSQIIKRRP